MHTKTRALDDWQPLGIRREGTAREGGLPPLPYDWSCCASSPTDLEDTAKGSEDESQDGSLFSYTEGQYQMMTILQ